MRYDNRGLFSNHFLATRLIDMPQWQLCVVDQQQRARMRDILARAQPGLPTANEAQTEQDLIRPLLDTLGFHYDVQTGLPAWAGRSVPDYAIFPTLDARAAALPLRGTSDFWPFSSALEDAKAWSVGLDQAGAGGAGRTPAQQIAEYLRDSDRPWGVLTNGQTWRLYTRQQGRRATDRGERLRDRAFRTVEVLCQGFARHEGWNDPPSERRRQIYENALVFLYRLLFILSAEARGLVPIDNPTYRDHYSLRRLRQEVRDRHAARAWAGSSCALYQSLRSLFQLIDGGDDGLSIPPYNGGLFDEEAHNFLRDSCCPDPELGEAIFQLAFDHHDNVIEPIDYRDIASRDLGTIYEGLLEFRLATATRPLTVATRERVEVYVPASGNQPVVVDTGELYLQNDRGDRRASGSYYTPDYIVDYMVANSLEPSLAARSEAVANHLVELSQTAEQTDDEQERQAVELERRLYADTVGEHLLQVRVLDPAMGSGHFLVAAMHAITDSIFTDPNFRSPEDDPDGLLLRRRVAERCLFGVDMNPLAVELARLTIWLETVSPDRPLSFLDHHLKTGNSLLGGQLSDLRSLRIGQGGAQLTIAEQQFDQELPNVMSELVAVVARDARTREDIEEKEAHAREADALLARYRRVLNLWLAIAGFRQSGDQDFMEVAMYGITDPAQQVAAEADARWGPALDFARARSFFHWELEFPDAFFGSDGHRLSDPGYDLVIGNPPYEVLETRRSDYRDADGNWTADGEDRYNARVAELTEQRRFFRLGFFPNAAPARGGHGKLDYFRLFIERALGLTRFRGALTLIVPRSLLGDEASTGVRTLLWRTTAIVPLDAFPKDPPQCWVFPEAELAVAVFVARRVEAPGTLRVREHPCNQISEREFANVTIADARMLDEATLPIPVAHPDDLPILRRLYDSPEIVRFKEIAPCHIGEINSQHGAPLMRGQPTANLLIRGRHIARYRLDERPSTDTATRWIDEAAYIASLAEPNHRPALEPRIAKQAITDLNDPRRIIAALCPAGRYLVDSCDYLQPSDPYEAAYTLAILLSDVAEWRFRMTSSNNNVNAYEIDALPFPAINDWNAESREEDAAELGTRVLALADGPDPASATLVFFEEAIARDVPRSALHDVVTQLVNEVSTLRGQAFSQLDTFNLLLRALPNGNRLTADFAMGGWVARMEAEFFAEISRRGLQLGAAAVARLRADRSTVLTALRPLVERSDRLDEALNSSAYVLFGLSDGERAAISSRLPPRPSFLPRLAPV
jgi:hypothetical protein